MDFEMDFVIDPEFEKMLGPLDELELTQLEDSLLVEGCKDPLQVAQLYGSTDKTLLDGHNRLALCKKHKIPFKTRVLTHICDRETAVEWIMQNNVGRRNLQKDSEVRARFYEMTKNKRGGSVRRVKEQRTEGEDSMGSTLPIDNDRQDSKQVKAFAAKVGVSTRQLRHDAKWAKDKDKVRALFPDLDQMLMHNKTNKRAVQEAAKALDNNDEQRARNIILNLEQIAPAPRRGSKVWEKSNEKVKKSLAAAEAEPAPAEPEPFDRSKFPDIVTHEGHGAYKLNKEEEERRRVNREIEQAEKKAAAAAASANISPRTHIRSLDNIPRPDFRCEFRGRWTEYEEKRFDDLEKIASVENWEKFQVHYAAILEHLKAMETLRPDALHIMDARRCIADLVPMLEKLGSGILLY